MQSFHDFCMNVVVLVAIKVISESSVQYVPPAKTWPELIHKLGFCIICGWEPANQESWMLTDLDLNN